MGRRRPLTREELLEGIEALVRPGDDERSRELGLVRRTEQGEVFPCLGEPDVRRIEVDGELDVLVEFESEGTAVRVVADVFEKLPANWSGAISAEVQEQALVIRPGPEWNAEAGSKLQVRVQVRRPYALVARRGAWVRAIGMRQTRAEITVRDESEVTLEGQVGDLCCRLIGSGTELLADDFWCRSLNFLVTDGVLRAHVKNLVEGSIVGTGGVFIRGRATLGATFVEGLGSVGMFPTSPKFSAFNKTRSDKGRFYGASGWQR